jgi:hypothetical protein
MAKKGKKKINEKRSVKFTEKYGDNKYAFMYRIKNRF